MVESGEIMCDGVKYHMGEYFGQETLFVEKFRGDLPKPKYSDDRVEITASSKA